ncbi:MAG: monovalent cation/H+ antiporter subunit E [Halobacteriales archaeon]|nr:monovalent cation/H+ antiporter subunit E [Halobacteriales archaeon]
MPISESRSVRNTVRYAVEQATDHIAESGDSAVIRFVYPLSKRLFFDENTGEAEEARSLLDRVEAWAKEDLGEQPNTTVEVYTSLIGTREYLFSPSDYADVLSRYARDNDISVVVFDPDFDPLGTTPLLPPLENELRRAGLDVQEAPVSRPRRGTLLVRRGTIAQFLGLATISSLFYLLLAGSLAPFELATGAISGLVVATALWGISLTTPIQPRQTFGRVGRLLLYIPYLVWQVVVANLKIAYVVLHPDLPIDPEVVEFDAAVWSALPVTMLANSITLTPGTVSVDVTRRHFTVHALTKDSKAGLLGGSLERAVRFVFYGRAAARIPSPLERRDTDEDETEVDR